MELLCIIKSTERKVKAALWLFHLSGKCYMAVKHVVNDSPAISATHSQAHHIKRKKTSCKNESLNRN